MNNILFRLSILIGIISLTCMYACQKDAFENINISAPQNLSMEIVVSDDESGDVRVKPQAEGASYFDIYYGETSSEVPQSVQAGEVGTHTYKEGDYTIRVVAYNLSGQSIEASQNIMLRFSAPENLMLEVIVDPVNTNVVTVTPTADNATSYDVYFGENSEEEATTIMAGESAMHSYTADGTYNIRVIAKSASSTTTEATQSVTIVLPAKQLSLPIDFEDPELDYEFISFGNANVGGTTNPDQSGINTSGNVGSFFKANGAEVWAGGVIELPNPIDFSSEDQFKMKVWSPKVGASVLVKLENASNNEIFAEVQAPTTTSNEWHELSFDFSSIDKSQSYHKIVLFIDFGVTGDDSQYYFDDLTLGSSSGGGGGDEGSGNTNDPLELPVSFESDNVEYTFFNFGNANSIVVDNPDASGTNTSSKVAELNKANGAETWAGSFLTMTNPIDLSNASTISIKTWSPKSGINVLLKLENESDGEIFYEVQIQNSVANQWETMSFDISGIDKSQSYQKVVIFFDFGTSGDNSSYYFDDISLL